MRRPKTLLGGLDLARDIRGPFETFGEFSFEFCLFRVHAILPERLANQPYGPQLNASNPKSPIDDFGNLKKLSIPDMHPGVSTANICS